MKYWRIDDHTEIVEIVAEDFLTITYKDINSGEESSMPREKFEKNFEPYSNGSHVEDPAQVVTNPFSQINLAAVPLMMFAAAAIQSKEKQLQENKTELNLTNKRWLQYPERFGQLGSNKELEKQNKQLVEKSEKLEKDKEKLETQLKMAKEEIARLLSGGDSGLLEQIEMLNAEISRLNDERKISEEHIDRLQKQLDQLQEDSGVSKKKLKDKKKRLKIKVKK